MTSTTHKTLRGPRSGIILSKGIASNPLVDLEKTIQNLPTIIDRTVFPGVQGGPHMNTILAKAVAFREAEKPDFAVYAKNVVDNAKLLAEELMGKGVKLVTNGTDNHMMLIDVKKSYNIDGAVAEKALDLAGLTVNKNVIPDDKQPMYAPSGIRLGTPAITTRGFNTSHMSQLATWITDALIHYQDQQALEKIKLEVAELAKQYPLPSNH
jgi:glycine hydroxymethyltransferase